MRPEAQTVVEVRELVHAVDDVGRDRSDDEGGERHVATCGTNGESDADVTGYQCLCGLCDLWPTRGPTCLVSSRPSSVR